MNASIYSNIHTQETFEKFLELKNSDKKGSIRMFKLEEEIFPLSTRYLSRYGSQATQNPLRPENIYMHGGVGHHWFDQIETYDSRQRLIS